MNILKKFVQEYNNKYIKINKIKEDGLIGEIKYIKGKLLDDKFFPSLELKQILNKQIRKVRYPMEIAIVGQFSSGKSTFLNALLSKDILPVGITPVTSKVNFLNYGKEYKLKITYYSGAQEYVPIEDISKFTDQRENSLLDIKYLSIYAPIEILKTISFVDTPGLNSQSQDDTNTTKNILRDVGGIIWLSLIDNAGKLSESQILEEFIPLFKDKSLCVLNQKDKFTNEQVNTTSQYLAKTFFKYFSKVIAISAKLALEARSHQKNVLLDNEKTKLLDDIHLALKNNNFKKEILQNRYDLYEKSILKISSYNNKNYDNLLKQSNIQEVLDFINNDLKPKAKQAKEYSIKQDLKNICDILINEYETIKEVYSSLEHILISFQDEISSNFDEINEKYNSELISLNSFFHTICEKIAHEIYTNINKQEDIIYIKKESLFAKNTYVQEKYDSISIDINNINKNLFYDDQTINKLIIKALRDFKYIQINSSKSFMDIYTKINNKVCKWQAPYELIKKHRQISSNLEFATTRNFASKVYENILKFYYDAINSNISALRKKYAFLKGMLSYNYEHSVNSTILHFQDKIEESKILHNMDSTKFFIYNPSEEEILNKVKENLNLDEIEKFLISKRNYLYKITKFSKNQYLEINQNRIEFINKHKDIYISKIDDLVKIKEDI